MAHNPSYVGKTHVVTHIGRDEDSAVLGVHGDYGSARNTIDKHLGSKAVRTAGLEPSPIYHHSDTDPEHAREYYYIHREGKYGKFEKV